jgi:hypothetical protein
MQTSETMIDLAAIADGCSDLKVQRHLVDLGRTTWGKPNNRVTSRKVGHCFGRNLVTAHITSGQMSLATAVFLSGDTKSSHFRCGNRPMANPTMASGPSFIVSAKSKPAQPLAAARYFAAGDTSVGFSPASGAEVVDCRPFQATGTS